VNRFSQVVPEKRPLKQFVFALGIIIIIVVIINDIYIAQIRKIQQMCYQQLNRKVFNCFLNTTREMSGDRSSAGKLFQITGPCTANLRLT